MRHSGSTRFGLCGNLPAAVDMPDESMWDETTCNMAICQHPQCWAAICRIERGHPRLLEGPCKTLEFEDKFPTLTIVNLSDDCIPACRLACHPQLPRIAIHKPRSLRPRGPTIGSKFSVSFLY
ncbi:uncharacterized protein C9orf43 homolog [Suncus etruscus]|uniref:uncharacterized protein C9orf43 homolog n=1 Tax=Suncus etruscus TaxID=109475 RepID=UPI002110395A|nr:uncharacterized protein C9orf43 homolog [Suncus etruscus]XP_049640995.1 uncharacterized protein C9orf43 homolog [Suncus etruscus]